jgi:lysozyme
MGFRDKGRVCFSRRELGISALASLMIGTSPSVRTVVPKDLNVDGHFTGIIDIYDGNDLVSLEDASNLGVRAVVHETGMGLYKKDRAYARRKEEAIQKNLMWGAYHLLSAESIEDQLDRFLGLEDGSDNRTAMALDWEPTSHGTMTHEALRTFVDKFHARTGFYPILYCDSRIRRLHGIVRGDPLLAKCPLWYACRRNHEDGPEIPSATWSTYALWQFDDEKRKNGAPYPPDVLPGADWNSFKGTEDELRRAWPFRTAWQGPKHGRRA